MPPDKAAEGHFATEPIAAAARDLAAVPQSAAISRLTSRSPSSLALDNLRGIVILIVLAFHSVLAYVSWAPRPQSAFNQPPYDWTAFPIIDRHSWFGFDLFCASQDLYLMTLMFFLSGLFVWPSLMRKKDWGFLRDRVLRLGLPYAFGMAVIMPLACYPSYRVSAVDPSVGDYVRTLFALPFWPNGPMWFLWQLMVLNVMAAVLHWLAPNAIKALGRWSAAAAARPGPYLLALVAASALAYVPLAVAFTPWAWSDVGIFTLQICRPLHYAVYFFAGVGIGVAGIDRGLLAADGVVARQWRVWLAAAPALCFLWMGLTGLTMNGNASTGLSVAADLTYVLACAAGCFSLIAVTLRFATARSPILHSFAANAYGLYLLHYVFVVWLQFALRDAALYAVVKAAIVFGGTLVLSWIAAVAVQRIPFGARLIGSARRAPASAAP